MQGKAKKKRWGKITLSEISNNLGIYMNLRFFTIVFSNLIWFKVTRLLGTSTSLPKGHSSWNSIITQDDVAGLQQCSGKHLPIGWCGWGGWGWGLTVGMAIGWKMWCKHLRALARSGYQNLKPTVRSTNMHQKKDVKWKTQAAHAGNSLLMSSSNPRPSKKIAAKYHLIQKDPERLSWASLSQTKQSEITTIGQTSTNTTLVSCS